jgi:lipoyl(octanoyl) transferase
VITLGRTTKEGSVLAPLFDLRSAGVQVVDVDRGGEATVHNPGQLVGYPIFDLQRSKPDLHWFLRSIEEAIILAVAEFGLTGGRVEGRTGVWIGGERKICAIGIHSRRWITTHGFALNVNNNLQLFDAIVPCGITDKGVTSLHHEVGFAVDMQDAKSAVIRAFDSVFARTAV